MSLVFLCYLNPDLRNISLIFITKGSLFLSLFNLERNALSFASISSRKRIASSPCKVGIAFLLLPYLCPPINLLYVLQNYKFSLYSPNFYI